MKTFFPKIQNWNKFKNIFSFLSLRGINDLYLSLKLYLYFYKLNEYSIYYYYNFNFVFDLNILFFDKYLFSKKCLQKKYMNVKHIIKNM